MARLKKEKNKKKIAKIIISSLLVVTLLVSAVLASYSLLLYEGVETFYRIYGIIIFAYFFIFLSYLLLRNINKEKIISFVITIVITLIIIAIEVVLFYYLTKIYKAIDNYSTDENMYYSSLITYNKELKNEKDLINKKIGIVNDTKDIEGNILPLQIIEDLKLKENNEIVEYNSTMELLYALKAKEIDAAFFSRNYVDMFYSIEGFENIETETTVLYETEKEYISTEEEIKDSSASLNKPFSMLLIGIDSSKDGVTSGYNADVLLLATFNPNTLRATLTSVPRDMYMKTACSGNNYRRINTTTWGSSSTCAVKTVEKLFNVNIDYYAKINFKGVVQLVDAVDGIDVDVDYPICEQNSNRFWGNDTVYVEKGKQHLNGEQALALARNRHKPNDGSAEGATMAEYCPTWTDGSRNDYTRGRNQMKVILGVVKSATKITDPNKIVDILEQIKSNFQTNVKSKDLLTLYDLAKSIVISDNSNLVNVQRMQLSGYSAWHHIYDPLSRSYPAVNIPYTGSINDIKREINANLNNSKLTSDKVINFDANNPYQDRIIGQGSYSESRIATLKNVSSYSVSNIKSYASSNNLSLKFIDSSTNKEVNINDWSDYSFDYQEEHQDTILNLVKTLTIHVKPNTSSVSQTQTDNNNDETTTDNTTENINDNINDNNNDNSNENNNSGNEQNQTTEIEPTQESTTEPTPNEPTPSNDNE